MNPSEPYVIDPRLERWLARQGHPPAQVEPLAGDVSARRYLRVESGGGTSIVAVYPPSMQSDCERFVATSDLLREAGVRVPEILASDCRQGWMMLEDLGPRTLYDLRDEPWPRLLPHLEAAVAAASRIAALAPSRVAPLNPPLDRALLERELEQTWRSFLEPRGLVGEAAAELRAGLSELCRHLGQRRAVPCHRDLMARNLVPLGGGELAVLDHQDLRLGPPFYDLASLLNDSLFPPAEIATALLGGPLGRDDELAYRRAAAQRALKAVGTFALFAERGNPRHLDLVPATLGRALDHLLELPETAAVSNRLTGRWRAFC